MIDRKMIIEVGTVGDECAIWACRVKESITAYKFDFRDYMGSDYYTYSSVDECLQWLVQAFSLDDGEFSSILFMYKDSNLETIVQDIVDAIRNNKSITLSIRHNMWDNKCLEDFFHKKSHLAKKDVIEILGQDKNYLIVGKEKIVFSTLGTFGIKIIEKVPESKNVVVEKAKEKVPKEEKASSQSNGIGSNDNARVRNNQVWVPGAKRKSAEKLKSDLEINPQESACIIKTEKNIDNHSEEPIPLEINHILNKAKENESDVKIATEEVNNEALLFRIQEQMTKL